ncbi:MAG: hypothetical protein ABJ360_04055 [Roseobacter sp.]
MMYALHAGADFSGEHRDVLSLRGPYDERGNEGGVVQMSFGGGPNEVYDYVFVSSNAGASHIMSYKRAMRICDQSVEQNIKCAAGVSCIAGGQCGLKFFPDLILT